MLGNDLNEFINDMYHNPEKEIIYHGKRYKITGYIDEVGQLYTLEICTIEKES